MTIDFELDGGMPCSGFVLPGKRSVELVPSLPADHHEIQASKPVDVCRNQVQGGDRSRVGDACLDSSLNAEYKIGHSGTSCFCDEAKKGSEAGALLLSTEIVQVRAVDPLSRDIAEPDSQRIVLSKLRDSRNEDGHGLCEEDKLMDESLQAKAGKARSRILQEAVSQGVRQAQLLHQQQQPQPQQAPVVRWERFLPQRQLRVLLVEDDDSTRHVVSALLRNCSYEVTFAANGLLAWELLLDQTNRIDLVLTEVVMPCLSGIGLLSRILGHEAFKHIPVIMMSSHDSMGIVFKCLSKGAVDFLVKPVRKNELKNLWQHVWRRCHSSSGSGSGSSSGSQTQKVASPKVSADCNISGSNDESDNTSSGLNAVGGSDNGSGTQSSWTKKVEVESSQHQTDWNLTYPNTGSTQHAPDQPDVQADSLKGFAFTVEPHIGKSFDATTGQDSEIVSLQLAATDSTYFHDDKGPLKSVCVLPENVPMIRTGDGLLENTKNGSLQEESVKAIDLIGAIAGKDKSSEDEEQGESGDGDDLLENCASISPISKDKALSDFNSPPLLELTLKRPSQFEDDDRERNVGHVLRHSCSSAFSRYNTNGNHTPSPSGTLPNIANCKFADCGVHATIQRSNIGSNNPFSVSFPPQLERAASSTCGTDKKTPVPLLSNLSNVNSNKDGCLPPTFPSSKDSFAAGVVKDEIMPLQTVSGTGMSVPIPLPHGILYDGLSSGYGSIHHPMFYVGHANVPHWGSQAPATGERGDDNDCCASREQSPANPTQPQTSHNPKAHHHSHHHNHHIQHHYHHHHCHKRLSQQGPMTPQQEDQTVTNIGGEAPICGSSNVVNGPEGNTGQSGSTNGYGSNGNGNGSISGSATGSNNGSSNGQSAAALAAGGNGDSCPQPGRSGTGTGNGLTADNGALSGLDQNRFARREAALTKFRQKRKERCFEKKVRYQSRKRLAEQRPRVRGQFVRQSVYESTAGEPG